MSQRVKTSARALVLTRSSQPENGHLGVPMGMNVLLSLWSSGGGINVLCHLGVPEGIHVLCHVVVPGIMNVRCHLGVPGDMNVLCHLGVHGGTNVL